MSEANVFYGELAPWWPVISPVEEYEEEAAWLRARCCCARSETCGRCSSSAAAVATAPIHLAPHFELTLVDRSQAMLDVSRVLNPDCTHTQADMRSVRLGTQFDAIYLHDAVDYLVSEAELTQTFLTAKAHCRPGGLVLVVPDHVRETFEPGEEMSGGDAPDGRSARLFEWSLDPDPSDDLVTTHYAFMLREADGGSSTARRRTSRGSSPRPAGWRCSKAPASRWRCCARTPTTIARRATRSSGTCATADPLRTGAGRPATLARRRPECRGPHRPPSPEGNA